MVCSYIKNCLGKRGDLKVYFLFHDMFGMLEAMATKGTCQEKNMGLKFVREGTQKCNRVENQEWWWRLTKPITS